MTIIGTHIAIPWDSCQPYYYGKYEGQLKNGQGCIIDVDWKTKAYNLDNEQVGTDQIAYWLCSFEHVKSIMSAIE